MNILVWGTGLVAEQFMSTVRATVIGFVSKDTPTESFSRNYMTGERKLVPAERVNQEAYDYLIIANGYSDEIYEECIQKNIDSNKLYFLLNNKKYNKDINDIERLEECIFDKNDFYTKVKTSVEEQINIPKMQYDAMDNTNVSTMFDYVRFRTFELVCNEIDNKKVAGEIAELGVFRGEFASLINRRFPNKKLYLFDTFEGFTPNELQKDMDKGYLNQEFADCFKNTSIDLVMSKMHFPQNCIIRKGYFPDTAQNLDEKFAFVSIDVDLEMPIYSGLEYFYPRLQQGGYIFIHDYNSKLKGVRSAVENYEANYGALIKMPICDLGGTLVILK